MVDGPFVEAPECIGGFWVIEAANQDAAVRWAAQASKALGGRIEVRAFQDPDGRLIERRSPAALSSATEFPRPSGSRLGFTSGNDAFPRGRR